MTKPIKDIPTLSGKEADKFAERMKKIDKVKQGKQNRASGLKFELKVRKNLEEKNWIICKWVNNVDLENNKLIPAKRKYNPFNKVMGIGVGFPDFIVFRKNILADRFFIEDFNIDIPANYSVIGVEAKSNGILSKIEKLKCQWYLDNHIFSKILIASKSKERGKIDYKYYQRTKK